MTNTRKYLAPSLFEYGKELIQILTNVNIVDFYINDSLYSKETKIANLKPYIYILIDTRGKIIYNHYTNIKESKLFFQTSLSFIKKQPYYVIDYPINKNDHLHMIVLKVNEQKFKLFCQGSFSGMYTQSEIDNYIPQHQTVKQKTIKNIVRMVLEKDKDYIDIFLNQLDKDFKLSSSTLDYIRSNIDNYEFDYSNFKNEQFR